MTDIQDIVKMHMQATERIEKLVAQHAKLEAAGKKREAAKVLARAEKIRLQLAALEVAVRPKGP